MQRNVNNVALSCDTWSEFKTYEYSHPLISFLPSFLFPPFFHRFSLRAKKKKNKRKKKRERKERIDGRYLKKKKKKVRGIANAGGGGGGGGKNRNAGRKIHGIRNTCFSGIRDTRTVGRSNFLALLVGKRRQVISS